MINNQWLILPTKLQDCWLIYIYSSNLCLFVCPVIIQNLIINLSKAIRDLVPKNRKMSLEKLILLLTLNLLVNSWRRSSGEIPSLKSLRMDLTWIQARSGIGLSNTSPALLSEAQSFLKLELKNCLFISNNWTNHSNFPACQ